MLGADQSGQIAALLLASDIAPDNGGSYDTCLLVQQYRAVHLSGQANASDLIAAHSGGCQRFRHRHAARAPPVARILLGPANLRRRESSVVFGSGGKQASLAINNQGARTSSADIDSQKIHSVALLAATGPAESCFSRIR